MSMFDDLTFEINCPDCDAEITVSKQQIGTSIICPNCKVSINLQDDGFCEELDSLENALDDLLENF